MLRKLGSKLLPLLFLITSFTWAAAPVPSKHLPHDSAQAQCEESLLPSAAQLAIADPFQLHKTLEKRAKDHRATLGFYNRELEFHFAVPEFASTLNWMINELEHAREGLIKLRDDHNERTIRRRLAFYRLVLTQAHQMRSSKMIPYEPFIKLSFLFSVAISLKDFQNRDRISRIFNGFAVENHIKDQLEKLEKIIRNDQGYFIIPTEKNLRIEDFVRIRPARLAFAGLITNDVIVDGTLMTPYDFFTHDALGHAVGAMKLDGLYFKPAYDWEGEYFHWLRNNGTLTRLTEEELIEWSSDCAMNFEFWSQKYKEELSKVEDFALRKAITIVAFLVMHEHAVSFDPQRFLSHIHFRSPDYYNNPEKLRERYICQSFLH